MFKKLAALVFCLISTLARSEDLVGMDCAIGGGPTNGHFVFDAGSQLVQFSPIDQKPLYAPNYGKISPATVTDTSLVIKAQSITRDPQSPVAISRITGNGEFKNAKGEAVSISCKPSSGPVSLISPAITADKDGVISVACKLVKSFTHKEHAGEPLSDEDGNIVVVPQSREAFMSGKDGQKLLTIGSSGPDSIQLCLDSCSTGAIILNLMNGGGFFLNPWKDNFAFTSGDQLVCRNAPRPKSARKKF